MAEVGQIIYNLKDYNVTGGLISTKETSRAIDGIISSTADDYENKKIHIFGPAGEYRHGIVSIIDPTNSKVLTKLGIQAPVGTKFVINESEKILMVGRTGVYELDDDIMVQTLYFIQPQKYIYNDVSSNQLKEEGVRQLLAAEAARTASLEDLDSRFPGEKTDAYWAEYKTIQDTYNIQYDEGMNKYLRGLRGVYSLPSQYYDVQDSNKYPSYNKFPATGVEGIVYMALDTNDLYIYQNGSYVYLDSDYQDLYDIIVDYVVGD